jgi:hypothetical protein
MRSSSKAGDSVRQEALSLFRVPQSMSARIRWCFLIFAAMDAAFIISLIIFKSSQVRSRHDSNVLPDGNWALTSAHEPE